MEHSVISCQTEMLKERRSKEGVYALLKIKWRRSVKYAVAIEDRAGSDLALLCGTDARCLALFDQIVEEELSSIQLAEVAEDFRCTEILENF